MIGWESGWFVYSVAIVIATGLEIWTKRSYRRRGVAGKSPPPEPEGLARRALSELARQ